MIPITLPAAELKPALAGLGKLINSKVIHPVLQCVRIERTAEGWIALTTSDNDRFITLRFEQPAEGQPLSMLVPYETLVNLTRSAKREEKINLLPHPDHKSVTISLSLAGQCGDSTVQSFPVSEFPSIPRIQGNPVPIPSPVRHSIHEAMQCAGDDPMRKVLRGAFIDVSQPKSHYIVATDGKHLYTSNSFHLPLKASLFVPKHKFLGWKEFNNDGEWQLKHSPEWVQINSRRWRFITRQFEGTYPRWRQVLPDQPVKTTITLNPQTLDALIQTIEKLPCHDEKYRTIGIELKGRQLHLLGKATPSESWLRVPIKAQKIEGHEITIFVNRQILQKALQFGLNTISLVDQISPLRFTHEGRQMIAMPLRPECVEARRSTPAPVEEQPMPPPQISTMTPPTPSVPDQPLTMEAVIETVHHVRESFIHGVNRLRDLGLQLKSIQREQKSSSRELNSVRSTLRSLQGMKL